MQAVRLTRWEPKEVCAFQQAFCSACSPQSQSSHLRGLGHHRLVIAGSGLLPRGTSLWRVPHLPGAEALHRGPGWVGVAEGWAGVSVCAGMQGPCPGLWRLAPHYVSVPVLDLAQKGCPCVQVGPELEDSNGWDFSNHPGAFHCRPYTSKGRPPPGWNTRGCEATLTALLVPSHPTCSHAAACSFPPWPPPLL